MHLLQLHDAGRLVGVVVGAKGTREGGGIVGLGEEAVHGHALSQRHAMRALSAGMWPATMSRACRCGHGQ